MATAAQIDANRRNALKSTGPRTPAGKQASRFNAIKHCLDAHSLVIPGEDPAEFDALAQEYFDEYQPATPTERHYLHRLVTCDWLRARYLRIQADLLACLNPDDSPDPIARGRQHLDAVRSGDPLAKLFRQMNANERTYDRALAALRQAKAEADARNEANLEGEPDSGTDPLQPHEFAAFQQFIAPAPIAMIEEAVCPYPRKPA